MSEGTIQNIYEYQLRNFYDGVNNDRSGDLYDNYTYYTNNGGQDTPVLLELWRQYLTSIGYLITSSVQASRDSWITYYLSQGGGVPVLAWRFANNTPVRRTAGVYWLRAA